MSIGNNNISPLNDSSPLSLIQTLNHYAVEQYGALFIFLPMPRRQEDNDVYSWVDYLKSIGSVKQRWMLSADQASSTVRNAKPQLFRDETISFQVYRIDRAKLQDVLEKLA